MTDYLMIYNGITIMTEVSSKLEIYQELLSFGHRATIMAHESRGRFMGITGMPNMPKVEDVVPQVSGRFQDKTHYLQ